MMDEGRGEGGLEAVVLLLLLLFLLLLLEPRNHHEQRAEVGYFNLWDEYRPPLLVVVCHVT